MPDAYERPLTRREKKQQKKLARQAEDIRRKQMAMEEKRRAAAEKEAAKQARIQAKQDAKMFKWEEKEARKRAKREAKLAKKGRGGYVPETDVKYSPAAAPPFASACIRAGSSSRWSALTLEFEAI